MNSKRIEIIGNVAYVTELENSISYKVAVNESRKADSGNYETVTTFFNTIIKKDSKTTFNVGDLVKIFGNFNASAFTDKQGEPKSEITIFPLDIQVFKRAKKSDDLPE